jgi:glycosyltransferase involved in cell wall biosynthesis
MVSLVMPVWKPNPVWFAEAVRSALGQRHCSLELIVVDDGSPEPVAALLDDVEDDRLTVVAIPHGGVSRARNAGLERARGDAVRFIDADDVLEPDSTARLLGLSGPERALAYGSTLVCDPELRPRKLVEETSQGDVLLDSVLGGFDVYITAMLFPREVFAAAGMFDPELEPNEDFEFLLRALEHAPVRGERFVATRYRRHGGSVTAAEPAGGRKDVEALERLFGRRPDLLGTRFEREARAHLEVNAAAQLLHAGRYRECLRKARAALGFDRRRAAAELGALLAGFLRLAARRRLASRGQAGSRQT